MAEASIHHRDRIGEQGLGRSLLDAGAVERRTYFLSGFDPRGIAHYQRLFQAELRPLGWRLGRRRGEGVLTRWPLQSRPPAAAGADPAGLELCFLHWDDIARSHWPRHPFTLLVRGAHFARFYLLEGVCWRVARLCPGVALCGAYPLIWLALAAAVAAAAALVIPAPWGWLLAALLLWGCWRGADALGVVWLSRSLLFTHRLGEARDRDLRERVRELADAMLRLEDSCPAGRVRLVGHSSGSFVLAMLAAELHRRVDAGGLLQKLELLTLGQNLANLAVYPGAGGFRQDLQELCRAPRIPWRDVTSRHDLLCFAGVNPFTSCGLPLPAGEPYPEMTLLNLRQARGLGRCGWLLQLFDLHFDYLRRGCPGVDLPGLLVGRDG